jgi:hypothetical protein
LAAFLTVTVILMIAVAVAAVSSTLSYICTQRASRPELDGLGDFSLSCL